MKRSFSLYNILSCASIFWALGLSTPANAQPLHSTLRGTLGKAFAGQPVYGCVFDFDTDQYPTPVILIQVDTDGNFNTTLEHPPHALLKISIGGEKYTTIGLDGESTLTVSQADGKIHFSGSKANTEMRAFRRQIDALNERFFASLIQRVTVAMEQNDTLLIQQLEGEKNDSLARFILALEASVEAIQNPSAIFDALGFLDDNKNRSFIINKVKQLKISYPDAAFVQNLERRVIKMQTNQVGTKPSPFQITDREGNIRTPDQYRGKYLYIDFWASWCLPCRIENPKLTAIYQQTNNTDFDILGISLDAQEVDWLNAIEKDGIPWPQANDPRKVVADQFGVSSLPQNLLLDRQGIIIAKNISAEQLKEILTRELEK